MKKQRSTNYVMAALLALSTITASVHAEDSAKKINADDFPAANIELANAYKTDLSDQANFEEEGESWWDRLNEAWEDYVVTPYEYLQYKVKKKGVIGAGKDVGGTMAKAAAKKKKQLAAMAGTGLGAAGLWYLYRRNRPGAQNPAQGGQNGDEQV